MKQDIETYLIDSFIDFEGKEHKIVACALSQSPINTKYESLKVGWVSPNEMMDTENTLCHDVYRLVTIGIAICNPEDPFNEETGKKIAYGKAANREDLPRIYTPNKGIITGELVDAFLKQQVRFFKENPGTLINGYDKAKEAYETRQNTMKAIDNFTDEEKSVFELALKGFDFSKYVDLARIYVNKILNKN